MQYFKKPQNTNRKKCILGIDPGLADTGYGVIEKCGELLLLKEYGSIKTEKNKNFCKRLEEISQAIKKIIHSFKPDYIAVEEIFFYKNLKTALKIGQVKGAILLTCQSTKIPIYEYTPLQVKQALVGYGRAEKHQVQQMAKILLGLKDIPKPDDAADALATAICCLHSLKL